jgi:hypothetical protein
VIFFSVWINCCSGYFNGVLYSYFWHMGLLMFQWFQKQCFN